MGKRQPAHLQLPAVEFARLGECQLGKFDRAAPLPALLFDDMPFHRLRGGLYNDRNFKGSTDAQDDDWRQRLEPSLAVETIERRLRVGLERNLPTHRRQERLDRRLRELDRGTVSILVSKLDAQTICQALKSGA